MAALAIDTLSFVKKLKAVNFSDEQAEALAQSVAELLQKELATSRDPKEPETALRRDLKELETRLERDLKDLEIRLTLRLGGIMAAGIAIVAAIVKLL